jgi:starch synthase
MAARLAEGAGRVIALFPWGDVVEEFLEPLGLSLPDFVERMSGGWLFGYVAALQSVGWRPFVACGSSTVDAPTRTRHRPTGAPLWLLPARAVPLPYSSRRSAAQWRATPWRAFRRALRAERCDALLLQEYEYARFEPLLLLGKSLGLPVFATFQGGDRSLSTLEAQLRPWSLPRAAGLIVASAQERERLATTYARLPPLADIPNPVDAEEWRGTPRAAARAALGLPAEDFIAITHGRIDVHRKGLDVLLAAWRELAPTHPRARLVLVGAGQDSERLAALLASPGLERVDWQARYTTDRVELRRWLSAADVYVTASRIEGMPVAPLEAMACGLPIVASRAQGLPDILAQGEHSGGLLVPCEDAPALAAALERLARAPALREALGRAARARIESHFAVPAVGRALQRFMTGAAP